MQFIVHLHPVWTEWVTSLFHFSMVTYLTLPHPKRKILTDSKKRRKKKELSPVSDFPSFYHIMTTYEVIMRSLQYYICASLNSFTPTCSNYSSTQVAEFPSRE